MSLEISFDSETFRMKFCEISRAISLENSREQRTKFVEICLHYFCTILYVFVVTIVMLMSLCLYIELKLTFHRYYKLNAKLKQTFGIL